MGNTKPPNHLRCRAVTVHGAFAVRCFSRRLVGELCASCSAKQAREGVKLRLVPEVKPVE